MDDIGGHFADILAKSVKSGQSLRGTGDNWNLSVLSSYMRKGISNKSMYLFASNIIVNRLSFSHLDNIYPKCQTTNIHRECLFPNLNELKTLRKNFQILLEEYVFSFSKNLNF